jgi:hypothetical protein
MSIPTPPRTRSGEFLVEQKIVDLARYRSAREEIELPLFARPLAAGPATITPFRPLSDREVAHRARMLAHLNAARR